MALLDRALVRMLPAVPRPVVKRLSGRHSAGPELGDALAVVRALEAVAIRAAYEEAMAEIEAHALDANVSVKLEGLGLLVDRELCAANVRALVRAAGERGCFVRIDMEDSSTTGVTLELDRELRAEGSDNVGIVLQATLRRTLDDVQELLPLRPNGRVCKGIYLEPPERGLGAGRYEYQTLLGVREKLAAELVLAGRTVRVYVRRLRP